MHFRRVTGGIRVSVTQPSTPASMEYTVAIWSFSIFNTKNAPKYQNFYLATQMEHDRSSYFCRGPWRVLLGPCPRGPHPGDGADSPTLRADVRWGCGCCGSEFEAGVNCCYTKHEIRVGHVTKARILDHLFKLLLQHDEQSFGGYFMTTTVK